MRGSTAHAVVIGGTAKPRNNSGVSRQAKVVIAAKIEVLATGHVNHRALGRLQGQPVTKETVPAAVFQGRAQALGENTHSSSLGRGCIVKPGAGRLRCFFYLPLLGRYPQACEQGHIGVCLRIWSG
jgi:hypothetical protein